MTGQSWPGSAAVVGAGRMGGGIAALFAVAGLQVRIVDADPAQTRQSFERLQRRVAAHVAAGLWEEATREKVMAIETADTIEQAVADANLVVEAVIERLDIKHDVLGRCARAAKPNAVIATNTSSLPIDELARVVQRPERFMGMHWFNPPEWTPGIELIPSRQTDPAVIAGVTTFLRLLDKVPTVVGSSPGFVGNRIQFAMFREAAACVAEGLASPQEVDAVVRTCFGFRLPFYGPFEIADMAGLDVYAYIYDILERGIDASFHVPEPIQQLVAQGRTGSNVGAGFYDYTTQQTANLEADRDRRFAQLARLLKEEGLLGGPAGSARR